MTVIWLFGTKKRRGKGNCCIYKQILKFELRNVSCTQERKEKGTLEKSVENQYNAMLKRNWEVEKKNRGQRKWKFSPE